MSSPSSRAWLLLAAVVQLLIHTTTGAPIVVNVTVTEEVENSTTVADWTAFGVLIGVVGFVFLLYVVAICIKYWGGSVAHFVPVAQGVAYAPTATADTQK